VDNAIVGVIIGIVSAAAAAAIGAAILSWQAARQSEGALIEMRREFVSDIQRILAPDLHNKEIARMIREGNVHRASDQTLGGLLPADVVPTGAERLLYGAPVVKNGVIP
jgi:hypothetical protein